MSGYGSIVAAVVRRPSLWVEALRMLKATGRGPRLTPPAEWLRWRVATAYGTDEVDIEPGDIIRFLKWRRLQRRIAL